MTGREGSFEKYKKSFELIGTANISWFEMPLCMYVVLCYSSHNGCSISAHHFLDNINTAVWVLLFPLGVCGNFLYSNYGITLWLSEISKVYPNCSLARRNENSIHPTNENKIFCLPGRRFFLPLRGPRNISSAGQTKTVIFVESLDEIYIDFVCWLDENRASGLPPLSVSRAWWRPVGGAPPAAVGEGGLLSN